MNTCFENKENQEYNEFMAKLSHKALELKKDFAKLSIINKKRVSETIHDYVAAQSFADFLDRLDRH